MIFAEKGILEKILVLFVNKMKTTHNRLKTVPAAIKAEEAKQAAEAAELAKRNPQPATAPPRRGVGLDDALGRDDWVEGRRTPGGGFPQLR